VRRALLAQWTALGRPRLIAGLLGAVALATGIATAIAVGTAGSEPGGRPGAPGGATIADVERASGVVGGVETGASLVGAIALALGASVVAGAFSGGTVRNMLVREPGRVRLLAGTWAGIATLVAAAAAIAVPLSAGLAFAIAGARGLDTSAWATGDGLGELLGALVTLPASAVGYATLGVALGAIIRSPGLAVGAGLAWVLPLESLLAVAWDGADRVLPGRLLAAVAEGAGAEVGLAAAAAGAATWAAAMAAAAAASLARRDVVS
jgi:ABC-2 type transport system permease protein